MSDERDLPDGDPLPVRAEQRLLAATSPMPWCPRAMMRGVGDGDCTVTSASNDVLGWSKTELASLSAEDLLHPDDRDGLSEVAPG